MTSNAAAEFAMAVVRRHQDEIRREVARSRHSRFRGRTP
jgi:hypothetical protein